MTTDLEGVLYAELQHSGIATQPLGYQMRRSGGIERGPEGSKGLLQAGHRSVRPLSGAMNTSNAWAFISTDAPRYATDTMRPPLGVSRTSSRE